MGTIKVGDLAVGVETAKPKSASIIYLAQHMMT